MHSNKGGHTPPAINSRDNKPRSQSPIRDISPSNSESMQVIFGQLMKKDKEIESLRAEITRLNDQIKEFEFLIVKASEEVKKKQQEYNELKSLTDIYKNNSVDVSRVSELQSQLIEARTQLKTFESQSHSALIQARVDFQKEKEYSNSLSLKLQDARNEIERMKDENKQVDDTHLQNYEALAQRHAKAEQENENALKIIQELKQANDYKNTTIDNAHQIIKKLKDENTVLKSDLELAQEKVKEYKTKSKTLKKNNQTHQEKIKDLEKQLSEAASAKTELERTKKDFSVVFNARRDEREKLEAENKELLTSNTAMKDTIANLREELARFETQNTFLTTQVDEEKMKTREICSQLVEKEELVTQLQEKLKEEEKRVQEEIDGFKSNAIKSLQIVSPNNRSISPNNRKASPFHSVVRVTSDIRPEPPQREISSTKSMYSKGFFRSTPVQSSKNSTEPIRIRESEVVRDFSSNHERATMASDGFRSSAADFNKSMSEKVPNATQPQDKLTASILSEEIQKAIDREELISLAVEANVAKAEAELANYKVPQVDEAALYRQYPSLEMVKKYNDLETKYNQALDIISEMKTGSKGYVEKIETLMRELNIANKLLEDYSKIINQETSIVTDQITTSLLTDSKQLFKTYETVGSQSLRGLKANSERAKALSAELDKLSNELKMVEEVIDRHTQESFSLEETKYKSLTSSASKKSVLRKLNTLIKNFEHKCEEIDAENKRLFDKLTKTERDYQHLKGISSRLEKDYHDSLREKDEIILKKDEIIRNRDEVISQREKQYSQNYEKLTEISTKENRIITLLNEKEENIRILSSEREALAQQVEDLQIHCNELRKQIDQRDIEMATRFRTLSEKSKEQQDRSRDLMVKHERIAELQKEIMNKSKEILDLEEALDKRTYQLQDKDKIISRLQEELRQLPLLQEESKHVQRLQLENQDLKRELIETQNQLTKNVDPLVTFESRRSPHKVSVDSYFNKSRTDEVSPPKILKSTEKQPQQQDPGLKKEIECLRTENKELLKKLGWLNETIAQLTSERGNNSLRGKQPPRKQSDDSFLRASGDVPIRESIIEHQPQQQTQQNYYTSQREDPMRSSSNPKKLFDSTSLFENNFIDQSMNVIDDKEGVGRDSSKNLKENLQINSNVNKEDPAFIERYKNKTKKIFQKRVKELELVLRYIDLKIKGFNFSKGAYISPTVGSQPAQDDNAMLTRVFYLIEAVLEKNSNLKNFINDITKNIERIYLRQYNMTITLTKLFKSLFVNSIDTENYSTLNQFGLLSELEVLFELNIPANAESFENIEILTSSHLRNQNQNFFKVFERIEPKLNFLQDYLISTMKQTNEMKLKYQSFQSQAKDVVKAKKDRIYDLETVYMKLRSVAEKTKPSNISIDHFRNFTQTFHNLYTASLQDWQDTLQFIQHTSNSSPERVIKPGSTVIYGRQKDASQGHATITPWLNDQSKTTSSIQNTSDYYAGYGRDDNSLIGGRSVGNRPDEKRGRERSLDKQKQMNDIILQIESLDVGSGYKKRSASNENDKASQKKTAKKQFY